MSGKAYKRHQKCNNLKRPRRRPQLLDPNKTPSRPRRGSGAGLPKLTGKDWLKARGYFGKEGYNELSPEIRRELERESEDF